MSGLFTFLLIIQTLVALALITLILMQRSEGGGLAGGGSPAGMMSARGASDFLTRGTAILATMFVVLSILLAGLAAGAARHRPVDPGARQRPPPARGSAPAARRAAPTPRPPPAAPAAPAGQRSPPAPGQSAAPASARSQALWPKINPIRRLARPRPGRSKP